ncbi:hypothetical protein BC827DRAFT_1155150 [Russula dissimulans]|nr:hypothetical protein BC827DRAFT_1155150 [Russula dissimulans]
MAHLPVEGRALRLALPLERASANDPHSHPTGPQVRLADRFMTHSQYRYRGYRGTFQRNSRYARPFTVAHAPQERNGKRRRNPLTPLHSWKSQAQSGGLKHLAEQKGERVGEASEARRRVRVSEKRDGKMEMKRHGSAFATTKRWSALEMQVNEQRGKAIKQQGKQINGRPLWGSGDVDDREELEAVQRKWRKRKCKAESGKRKKY